MLVLNDFFSLSLANHEYICIAETWIPKFDSQIDWRPCPVVRKLNCSFKSGKFESHRGKVDTFLSCCGKREENLKEPQLASEITILEPTHLVAQ